MYHLVLFCSVNFVIAFLMKLPLKSWKLILEIIVPAGRAERPKRHPSCSLSRIGNFFGAYRIHYKTGSRKMRIRLVNFFRYLETSGRGCFIQDELKLTSKKKQVFYFSSKLCYFKVTLVLFK